LEVQLIGASDTTTTAYTSNPLGIFIAGLDVIGPNGLLLDDSQMLGEYNVSVIVGDPVSSPNLPTAVGIPLGVYLNTAFCNNKQLSITIDCNDFNSPYTGSKTQPFPIGPRNVIWPCSQTQMAKLTSSTSPHLLKTGSKIYRLKPTPKFSASTFKNFQSNTPLPALQKCMTYALKFAGKAFAKSGWKKG
jgi:hypothetical protein